MTALSKTYTLSNGTTADASQVETNFTDIVGYINNRNSASATWDNVNATTSSIATLAVTGDLTLTGSLINQSKVFQARLTLATGTAITTSDQTAKTTVYLTPFRGNIVSLYNGTNWKEHVLTEISISVPATTSTMYDLFVYDSSGTLTLEAVAWTNDTTRATALTTQSGVLVKNGTVTKRYAGSFRTTGSSGQTEDSDAKRYLWNYYNRVGRIMKVIETTDSWAYSTDTFRQTNAAAGNQLDCIIGVSEDFVEVSAYSSFSSDGAGSYAAAGIGIDSTSTNSAQILASSTTGATSARLISAAHYKGYPGVGRHAIVWLERAVAGVTTTFYGDAGVPTIRQTGIFGAYLG